MNPWTNVEPGDLVIYRVKHGAHGDDREKLAIYMGIQEDPEAKFNDYPVHLRWFLIGNTVDFEATGWDGSTEVRVLSRFRDCVR